MSGADDPFAAEAPEPVQWLEGMLLSPQHMQIEARRLEATLCHRLRAANPFFWGVRRLEIDTLALSAGLLRVTALDALTPDGLAVSHPRPDAPELEINLKDLEIDLAAQPATVHLAVAAHGPRAAAPGALRRYHSVDAPPAADENFGHNAIAVPRLRPALALAVTESPLVGPGAAYVSLPLAVAALRGGAHVLLPFQPPLLRVRRDAPIHAEACAVAEDMRAKASAVADRLRAADSGAGVESRDAAAALRALVGPLPRLEALLRDEAASPYQLYLSLCDALGAAAAIDHRLGPPLSPPYVHADALPAFVALRRVITDALKRLRAAYRLRAFEPLGGGGFALPGAHAPAGQAFHVVLQSGGAAGAGALAAWAAQAVIASTDRMEAAQMSRIRGAARRRVDGVPALDMLAPEGAVLIEVAGDPRYVTRGAALELRHVEGAGQPGEPISVALVVAEADDDAPDVAP